MAAVGVDWWDGDYGGADFLNKGLLRGPVGGAYVGAGFVGFVEEDWWC